MLDFNAIDVETANADHSSICQIGIAHIRDYKIVDEWKTLVNPECCFDPVNIGIHGIDEFRVKDSPKLPQIRDELRRRLRGSVLVSHTSFDRVAFERAMEKYDLEQLQVAWLDSSRIARLTWKKYNQRGYGLGDIAYDLGIKFNHHDALEDAKASAKIVIEAIHKTGMEIEDWIVDTKFSIKKESPKLQKIQGFQTENRNGNFSEDVVVFSGTFSLSRKKIIEIATDNGCEVGSNVTKKTSILVVGIPINHYTRELYKKSSKHKKAEELLRKGNKIKILSENDFIDLLNKAG